MFVLLVLYTRIIQDDLDSVWRDCILVSMFRDWQMTDERLMVIGLVNIFWLRNGCQGSRYLYAYLHEGRTTVCDCLNRGPQPNSCVAQAYIVPQQFTSMRTRKEVLLFHHHWRFIVTECGLFFDIISWRGNTISHNNLYRPICTSVSGCSDSSSWWSTCLQSLQSVFSVLPLLFTHLCLTHNETLTSLTWVLETGYSHSQRGSASRIYLGFKLSFEDLLWSGPKSSTHSAENVYQRSKHWWLCQHLHFKAQIFYFK